MKHPHLLALAVLFAGLIVDTHTPAAPATRPAAPPAEPAPAKGPTTYWDLHRELLAYFRGQLVEPYRTVGRRNPKWDVAAEKLLDTTAQYLAAESVLPRYRPADAPIWRDLPPLSAAVDPSCDEPLVAFCAALALTESDELEQALPLYRKAVAGLADRAQPSYPLTAASIQVANLSAGKEGAQARDDAQGHIVKLCSGRLRNVERRVAADLMWQRLRPARPFQRKLAEALTQSPDVDPWVRDLYLGRLEIQLGWDGRGGGWANTVTRDGWEALRTHMNAARIALVRAWMLAPELPEAPVEMIHVIKGGSTEPGESLREWFDRARTAQRDYEPAWEVLFQALIPRWGGSYEQILAVGREALENPDYNTAIPWQFLTAVKYVGWDLKQPFAPMKEAEVYDAVVKMCDGYAKARGPGRDGDFFRSCHAAAAWQSGRRDDAGRVLRELLAAGRKPDSAAFVYFGFLEPELEIDAALAMTGPLGKEILAAYELGRDRAKLEESLARLRDALAKTPELDPGRRAVVTLVERVGRNVKYEAGEWVSIQPENNAFIGWELQEGRWNVRPDGSVVGRYNVWTLDGKEMGAASLIYRPEFTGRSIPTRWEMSGNIWFIEQPPGALRASGPVVFAPGTTLRGHYIIDPVRKIAGLALPNGTGMNGKANVRDGVEFLVQADGPILTLFVDGKQIGKPFTLPEQMRRGPSRLGLGGYGHSGSAAMRFSNLRIRKLDVPPANP